MVKRGEDLTFRAEAPQHHIGVHTAANDLDGDDHLKLVVIANGTIHGTHPAPADFFDQAVGADAVSGQSARMKGRKEISLGGPGFFQKIGGIVMGGEQGNYFRTNLRVGAGILEECDAFSGRTLEAILKQALHGGPI
jgi:hypothetical protein